MSPEQTVVTYGIRGKRVRVLTLTTATGTRLVRVEWRVNGKRERESWAFSRTNLVKAKAYARGVSDRLVVQQNLPRRPITLGALVTEYLQAHVDEWRMATMRSATYRLTKFLVFAGRDLALHDVQPELIDAFRVALRTAPTKRGKPHAAFQISQHVKAVKELMRFAKSRKRITENPLADYVMRLKKNEGRRSETFEFTNEEWGKLAAALDPKHPNRWRAHCLVVMGGTLGPRQRALLHLRWSDVDLAARTVTWRTEYDKMGKDDRPQPLPRDAVRALRIARVWRQRAGYQGLWVFFAVKHTKRDVAPYTYSALNAQIHRAEERAGVKTIPYRSMHGLRRTAMGNALDATGGNVKAAADWIGDDDLRTASKYAKKREVRLREVAALMRVPTATEQPSAVAVIIKERDDTTT